MDDLGVPPFLESRIWLYGSPALPKISGIIESFFVKTWAPDNKSHSSCVPQAFFEVVSRSGTTFEIDDIHNEQYQKRKNNLKYNKFN